MRLINVLNARPIRRCHDQASSGQLARYVLQHTMHPLFSFPSLSQSCPPLPRPEPDKYCNNRIARIIVSWETVNCCTRWLQNSRRDLLATVPHCSGVNTKWPSFWSTEEDSTKFYHNRCKTIFYSRLVHILFLKKI